MPDHIDLTDIRPRLPGRENPDGLSYGNLSYQADVNALHYICEELVNLATEMTIISFRWSSDARGTLLLASQNLYGLTNSESLYLSW